MYPTIRRFLREYLPGHGREYAWGILFLLLTIAATVTIPSLVSDAISVLEQANGPLTPPQIAELKGQAWWIVGLAGTLVVCRTLSRVIIFLPGRRVEAQLRQDFFESAISLPHERLDSLATGDLVSRATNDITAVRVLLSMGVLHVINSVLTLSVCAVMMLRISSRLTIICILLVPVVVLVVRLLSSRMMKQARIVQRQLGILTATVREQLQAHMLLTIYPVLDGVMKRFEHENDSYRRNAVELQRIRVILFNVAVTLSSLALFILLIAGGPLVIGGTLQVADFVEFSIYLALIQDPLRAWGFLISIFQRGEICLSRLYDLRDITEQYKSEQNARIVTTASAFEQKLDPTAPFLSIRNLRYQYPVREADAREEGDETPDPFELIIENMDLQFGKKYGLFGATGSGKTTLAELLSGNREAPTGTISCRGVPLDDVSAKVLMQQLAYVPQENRHFNQSIGENLQQIIDNNQDTAGTSLSLDTALNVSCLRRDVEGFKEGMDTVIGEHGVRLSGGQKQRLALVRALLKPHYGLVLDDIVSAVDHETETMILSQLYGALTPEETLLIISHRISALSRCDEIFILEEGRVVESGTHEALLERHEGYRSTWRHQIIEQKLEDLGHA